MIKYLLLLLLMVSCSSEVTIKEPIKPKEVTYSFAWKSPTRTKLLVAAIKRVRPPHRYAKVEHQLSTMVPKDWNTWSDKKPITEEEIINFWGNIMVEIAKWESNWVSSVKYKEAFNDNTGKNVYSRGLFQVSIESGRAYGGVIPNEESLHDDKINIETAASIIGYWMVRDGVIRGKETPTRKSDNGWRGSARYWAVLRGTYNKHTKDALKAIKLANR